MNETDSREVGQLAKETQSEHKGVEKKQSKGVKNVELWVLNGQTAGCITLGFGKCFFFDVMTP